MKLRTSLIGAIIALCNLSVQAELSIQITQGVDNPIPIAVVPFAIDSGGFFSEDVVANCYQRFRAGR